MKISVSPVYNIVEPLTYQAVPAPPGLKIGARVLIPLGKKIVSGWVLALDSPYSGRLKNIVGVIDSPFCPDETYLEFVRQIAAEYFVSAGSLLDHALPASQKALKNLCLELDGQAMPSAQAGTGQLEKLAAAAPLRFFFKSATNGPAAGTQPRRGVDAPFSRLLLDHDRSPDYREICEQVLSKSQSVILLVPDNASARYWQTVFPGIDLYNSATRPAAKEHIWAQYWQGKSGIVCGGLSALMLPLTNLGLLIIDRSASALYQRTYRSPFKIDRLARIRAQVERTPLLQGAASHSCSTYWQRDTISITDRRQDRGLSCQVHMLKSKDKGIPGDIIELIRGNFLQKKKTLILVNKIQSMCSLFCAHCGKIIACPRCGGILQVEEPRQASCRRCTFSQERLAECPRCQQELSLLHDISMDSLSRAIERGVGEKAVLNLTATSLKDSDRSVSAVQASPIVVATPAALNPFFKELFAAVIYIKPESFFSMDEFNSAEMIHATAAEIKETLMPGGELHVFSVFHFHYALQFIMDENKFFERELKYRQWFMLPPFFNVYRLEIKDTGLRSLAASMHGLYGKFKDELQIKRIYLASRLPKRGSYCGVLELHAAAEKVARSGLHKIKRSSLTLIAG